MNGISVPIKGTSEGALNLLPPREDPVRRRPSSDTEGEWAIIRHRLPWCLELGLSSLRNCKKLTFIV